MERSKEAFERAKGHLLDDKSLPPEGYNGEKQNNFEKVLNNKRMPENSQTSVLYDYQHFSKVPHFGRISNRRKTFLKSGAAFRGICKDFSKLFAGRFADVAGGAGGAGKLGASRLRARLCLLLRLLWQQHRQGLCHPLSSYAPLFP